MSEPSHPPRRFLALPVETTTRRQRSRFVVEPIEVTSKTNGKKTTQRGAGTTKESAKDARILESVETTTKANRSKVVPEPTQSTQYTQGESTAGPTEQGTESNKSKIAPIRITRQKFAPQLIETTRRSHRAGDARCAVERYNDDDGPPLLPRERTGTPTQNLGDVDGGPPLLPDERSQPPPQHPEENGDGPPLLSHERTQPPPLLPHERALSPPQHPGLPCSGEINGRRRPIPIPPANTRVTNSADMIHYPMPRRTSSTHPHHNTRRHSFAVPSLEPIMSQPNSDESNCPSLSNSPSLSSETSSMADLWHYASGMRESCDDRFSGYLLALAARAAEKQIREQAMAAYVNDDYHEPVEHFANDRVSDDSDTEVLGLGLVPRRGNADVDAMRHDSQDEFHLNAQGVRKQQAKLSHQRDEQKNHELDVGLARRLSTKGEIAASVWLTASDPSRAPKNIIGGWQRGIGLGPMRDAASPPMLGSNLLFRLCYSPQQTSSELDHLNRQNASKSKNCGGLWMGLCSVKLKGENTTSGVMSRSDKAPLNPKSTFSISQAKGVKEERDIDAEIDREFDDEFVTQVYNYLSLGYPCLARKFDVELSQVSGVALEEISSADLLADAKGYVGLGEGVGVAMAGVVDGRRGRWKALRSYIREWAKRSPGMEQGGVGPDTWGARARKGSWAI